VRENVAGPYCYFLMLTRKGRRALHDHCDLPPEQTHPVPFIAVLGNHDVGLDQGVKLQREDIPRFVGNWLMPEEARSYELGGGVSLIAYNSRDHARRATTALERALRESQAVAHRRRAPPDREPGAGWHGEDTDPVLAAIAPRAGRAPVPRRPPAQLRRCARPVRRCTSSRRRRRRDPRISPTPHERLVRGVSLRLRAGGRRRGGARDHAALAVRPLRQGRRAAREFASRRTAPSASCRCAQPQLRRPLVAGRRARVRR
jgi:hypothetical protein